MIHVIGAGWYGCHLISSVLEGHHDYVCWEKSSEVMSGASSHNQNRLHLGFHYPRNHLTRVQSRNGFHRFIDLYGFCTSPINRNVYAISNESVVDFTSFMAVYNHENYRFDLLNCASLSLQNCEGAIRVDEMLIEHRKAKEYWKVRNLKINFNQNVTLSAGNLYDNFGARINQAGDVIIDCTWGGLTIPSGYYEDYFLTFVIRCELGEVDALTIMDGPFFSIYPFGGNEAEAMWYTLTHVKLGIMGNGELDMADVKTIFQLVTADVRKYCPEIAGSIQFEDCFISRKLKPLSLSHSRATTVKREGNLITVIGGKIDAIFEAEELLTRELHDALSR